MPEASGHARWFERLLAELLFELWIGDAAEIRTKRGITDPVRLPLQSAHNDAHRISSPGTGLIRQCHARRVMTV
jgi:hypothetical protein